MTIQGRSLALDWKAGRFKDTALVAPISVALRALYRVAKIRKALAPWMLLVDAGIISVWEAAQFHLKRKKARWIGTGLRQLIREIPNATNHPINLIGHSLGTEIIVSTLMKEDWSANHVHDCVFLGGTASANRMGEELFSQIDGCVYNGYSKDDMILKAALGAGRCVGKRELTIEGQERIVNVDCSSFLPKTPPAVIAHHTAYWSEIDEILPLVWQTMPR